MWWFCMWRVLIGGGPPPSVALGTHMFANTWEEQTWSWPSLWSFISVRLRNGINLFLKLLERKQADFLSPRSPANPQWLTNSLAEAEFLRLVQPKLLVKACSCTLLWSVSAVEARCWEEILIMTLDCFTANQLFDPVIFSNEFVYFWLKVSPNS